MKFSGNLVFCRLLHIQNRRYLSNLTNESVRQFKNELFSKEKSRQQSLTTRIEKIEVAYKGVPSETTLMMNKNISTPYNCAMHIHEFLCDRAVLANVNGMPWDMHRPLTDSCELRFLNFHTHPEVLNKVFWRSCSFLLGMIVERAFKDEFFINLHSWPKPNICSGSYVYDVDVGVSSWKATSEELKSFTTMMWKLSAENIPFDRLVISKSLALEMFAHNKYKLAQIPQIEGDEIIVYRVKDHVDISCGPMIGSTKFVGTTQITAVHQLDNDAGYRFQGVSIPKQLTLNSYAFSVLVNRAKNLNVTGLGTEVVSEKEKVKDVRT